MGAGNSFSCQPCSCQIATEETSNIQHRTALPRSTLHRKRSGHQEAQNTQSFGTRTLRTGKWETGNSFSCQPYSCQIATEETSNTEHRTARTRSTLHRKRSGRQPPRGTNSAKLMGGRSAGARTAESARPVCQPRMSQRAGRLDTNSTNGRELNSNRCSSLIFPGGRMFQW